MILANNAPENATLEALGLAHLAQATGIQNMVLVPHRLGRAHAWLPAGCRQDGLPFDQMTCAC